MEKPRRPLIPKSTTLGRAGDQVGSDPLNSPDGVWLFFGLRVSMATGIMAGVALPFEQTVSAESAAPFEIGFHQTVVVLLTTNCAGSACTLAPLCDICLRVSPHCRAQF